MPKKSLRKKKAYREFCRQQVVEKGLINRPNGDWERANTARAMDRDMLAGYKVR